MPDSNILGSASKSYAVGRAAPIMVDAPLSSQIAQQSTRPSQITYEQASDDHLQTMDTIARAKSANVDAMRKISAFAAKKYDEAQEAEFANGYLRHMQGESVASIAKDNPFFGLFGDGGAVRGAQAAQAETAGSSLMEWVQNNQGELSRMTADQQRAAIAKYTKDLETGDAVADTLIARGAMKIMPAVMDNLTRASVEEQQRQAAINQAEAISTAGKALQYANNELATGRLDPAQYDLLKAQFIQASAPLPGQSAESYRAAMQGNVMSLVRNGQFEMANEIRDKLLNPMLLPAEQAQFEAQLKASNAEWLLNNPISRDYTEFMTQAPAQIASGRYTSQEQLYADIDRMNADYKVESGDVKPLIDNEKRGRLGAAWLQWQTQNQEALGRQQAAEMDDMVKAASWRQGFALGSPSQMGASGLDAKRKAAFEQSETAKFFSEQGTNTSAEAIGRLAVAGYTVAPLKEQLDGTLGILKGGGLPKQEDVLRLQLAYSKLASTPYSAGVLDKYFGDDLQIMRDASNLDLTKSNNVQFLREKAMAKATPVKPTQEQLTAANDLVDSEVLPGWWSRTFGDSQQLGAGFENMIRDDMKRHTAEVMAKYPNMSSEEALKVAASRSMDGKDVAGNYIIGNSKPGATVQELNKYLKLPLQSASDPRLNVIINDAVRARVPEQFDFNVGSISALPNGKVVVTVLRDSGTEQVIPMNLSDVAELYNNKQSKKVQDTKATRKASQATTDNLRDIYDRSQKRGIQ